MITTENPKHIQLHEAGACLQGYKERTCPIGTITVATETAAGQGESSERVCSKTTNKETNHGGKRIEHSVRGRSQVCFAANRNTTVTLRQRRRKV